MLKSYKDKLNVSQANCQNEQVEKYKLHNNQIELVI